MLICTISEARSSCIVCISPVSAKKNWIFLLAVIGKKAIRWVCPYFSEAGFITSDPFASRIVSSVFCVEIFFYYWWGGTKSLGTAATSGLLYKPPMIDEDDCGAIGGMKIGRRNRSTRRKPAPAPLCPPQNPT
jgi:hypothetical protein